MNVFLIDDDELSTFLTRHWLVREGLCEEVQTFISAEEALTSLEQCPDYLLPQVIFLDLNMPVMSGWEFLDALSPQAARLKSRTQIYILTSSLDLNDEMRSKDYDLVAAFIHKPIKSEDIQLIRFHTGIYN
ncbi:response regulator [Adhaeribacter soli]|uniref:Response regulator n=1 Tax=Adhaeribacter soli TaxID=2607655 RepID=A0A5N1J4H1_9BACT|nr:response regulator [Adhaeribacter soli]KAA9345607.1 response regulator [Adhaeribacter soli]